MHTESTQSALRAAFGLKGGASREPGSARPVGRSPDRSPRSGRFPALGGGGRGVGVVLMPQPWERRHADPGRAPRTPGRRGALTLLLFEQFPGEGGCA